MRLIDRGDYFVLTADDAARIVRCERTPEPFPSLEVAEQTFERLLTIVNRSEFREHGLLIDVRRGPGRNDDAFERLVGRYRDRLFAPFTRCAMLVGTQVGLMQTQRLSRDREVHVQAFQQEAAALTYLKG